VDCRTYANLRIDTYGSRVQRGGHIAVASDSLLIYLHDRKSAKLYADAWNDAWYIASHLPKQVPTEPRGDTGPVMMAHANGSDDVQHDHDTARNVALIRIERLSWLLHDQAALGHRDRDVAAGREHRAPCQRDLGLKQFSSSSEGGGGAVAEKVVCRLVIAVQEGGNSLTITPEANI